MLLVGKGLILPLTQNCFFSISGSQRNVKINDDITKKNLKYLKHISLSSSVFSSFSMKVNFSLIKMLLEKGGSQKSRVSYLS